MSVPGTEAASVPFLPPGSSPDEFRGGLILAVANPARVVHLGRVAARIATARKIPVIVLYVTRRVSPIESTTLATHRVVEQAVGVLTEAGVSTAWQVRSGNDVGDEVRSAAAELQGSMIVVGWRGKIKPDGEEMHATLAALLHDPQSDVIVVGGDVRESFRSFLVPIGQGPHSELALEIAQELATISADNLHDGAEFITTLRVQKTTDAPAAALARSTESQRPPPIPIEAKAVMSDDTAAAILAELAHGYDVVVMGTSRESLIDRLLFGEIPQRIAEEGNATVLVVRRRTPRHTRTVRATWQKLVELTPSVSEAERMDVQAKVSAGALPRTDFFVLLALATIIASFGLELNSPAVIIGAMLIAPLMSAIIGIALGFVIGDVYLLKISVRSTGLGVLLAIGIGIIIGLIVPGVRATPEMLARTAPNVLDLAVALASGAAGAYAIGRKEVADAIAGVAVAAALAPPLAVVGIMISFGDWSLAGGALLLFTTNLIAIMAAGAVVFLLFGFAPPASEKERRALLRVGLVGTSALLVAIAIVLAVLSYQTISATRLDSEINEAITEQVATLPNAELVESSYVLLADGGLQIDIAVRSSEPLVYESSVRVQEDLAARLQHPVALLLTYIPSTRLDPLAPPTPTPTHTPTVTVTPTPVFSPTSSPTATPSPTATQTPTATATPTPTPSPTSTPTPLPTPASASITGTGGRGVLVRETPNGRVIGAVPEGATVFVLNQDGAGWLLILGPRGLQGWVAEQYVSVE